MRRNLPTIIVCLAIAVYIGGLLIATCRSREIITALVPAADNAMGRSVIYLLRKRHYTAIEAQLDPRDRTPNARAILEKKASVLPTSRPSRVNVMSWWTHVQLGGPKDTQLEYELTYPTNWIYVYVAMEENDGNTVLTSFRIKQLNESLE